MIDHPYTDPGDGRTECDVCGKWIFPVIHSCKRVPVTAAAMARHHARMGAERKRALDMLSAALRTTDRIERES